MKAKIVCAFLLLAASAQADSEIYGLNAVSKADKTEGATLEVTNTPPTMSQDTLGICYAYSASTMLTAENCRKLNEDCTKISEKKIFSPLHLASFGRVSEEGSNGSKTTNTNSVGGNTPNVLQEVAYNSGSAAAESCMSLDKVLSKVGGARQANEMQEKMWSDLNSNYEKLHSSAKNIDVDCPTCVSQFYSSGKTEIDEINSNFNISKSNSDILKAFSQNTYAKFLDQLLYPKECLRISRGVAFENTSKVTVEMYPKVSPDKKVRGNYTEALGHIKDTLTNGRLVSLGNICLDKNPSGEKCDNAHAVVISGYRKVCNAKNECRDAIKIINSWGQAWQDANNQGWVEAKTLLDRTQYKEASLAWFSDKK